MSNYFENLAINASSLKAILQNPAKYKHALTAEKTESKCFKVGSAVHCLVLESEEFSKRYDYLPEGIDKRTKEGREKFGILEAGGKTILRHDEWELVMAISESVLKHPSASKLFVSGLPEHEIYTEIDGTPAKAKLDYLRGNVIIDLKTTDDASPRGFEKSVFKYDYALQAAWYLDCSKADRFIFVAVEKTAPYLIGIYQLDDAVIEYGRKQYRKALEIYRECTEKNDWYGYSNAIETITLPNWAVNYE